MDKDSLVALVRKLPNDHSQNIRLVGSLAKLVLAANHDLFREIGGVKDSILENYVCL